MKKKHLSISQSLVDNHITVMETVDLATTNCGTGLDVERLNEGELDLFAL